MRILVIGNGGREHALIWKLLQSKKRNKIYCTPGNAGIAKHAECFNILAEDINGLLDLVKSKKIDLTIVGPENPLSLGIVNLFEKYKLPIFGPTKEAAEIESSKVFAKYFMDKYKIPTAKYQVFDDYSKSLFYVEKQTFPLVLKVDGLAGGKGVFVIDSLKEAKDIISEVMKGKRFGKAGNRLVIEEFLLGEEVSILAFSDGENFLPMLPSQDHKKINDGDKGSNTGGMGSYAPVPFLKDNDKKWILNNIFQPVIAGMKKEERIFKGVLYAGLILTKEGPKVLEFNARLGDPETQSILPILKTDLLDIVIASVEGNLKNVEVEWEEKSSVCVVMSSAGYPADYEKGKIINGLDELDGQKNMMVFHAGTANKEGKIITNGGRVLGVTAWADNLKDAIDNAYKGVDKIYFENQYYRKDIGEKGIKFTYR